MAKSVELTNGQVFNSKKTAEQHFREMLARYSDGDQISQYQDHSDLSALLERFDLLISDGPSKVGVGIKRFERRLNRGDGWSSPGFWVIRVDDTSTDFSYVKAVAGRPKSDAEEFAVACHNAVSRDLLAMKQKQFDHFGGADGLIGCDITGNLVGYSQAQLSHAHPPFGMIVKEFRNVKGWGETVPPGTLTVSADAQISTHFVDQAIAQEFLNFHHDRAVLRVIGKDRPPISLSSAPIVRRPLRFR